MRSIGDLSIRTKLLALLAAVVSLALVISSGVATVSDANRIRVAMAEHHGVLADVLGANSTAALNFDAPSSATEVLASLELEPTVIFACTYDAQGNVFATYRAKRGLGHAAPPVGAEGASFSNGNLEVFKRITQEKKTLGTIYLRVSLERLHEQISYNIRIAALMLILALAAALLLGWRLQRLITKSIFQLVQAATTVSQKGYYGLRVPKLANDELGLLCDGFNAMLAQIQKRDAELEQHRLHLEELVRDRTLKLEYKTVELVGANAALQAEIDERMSMEQKLRETTGELEEFVLLMVGREERIIELKRQINELAQALGRPALFDLTFAEEAPAKVNG